MKIEIISVSAMSEGEEVSLTVKISDGEGREQRKKFLIFSEQYLKLKIGKGSVIDEETFDKLEELSKLCRAMKKGSELLSYSPSSKRRLTKRLCEKGLDRESAEDAAYRLEKLGLIDEDSDVACAVQSCLKKLWGRTRIYQTLISKGYEHQYVSQHVGDIDKKTFIKNCIALIQKKYKGVPKEPDERKKMVASLMRYGYSYSEIKVACDFILKSNK